MKVVTESGHCLLHFVSLKNAQTEELYTHDGDAAVMCKKYSSINEMLTEYIDLNIEGHIPLTTPYYHVNNSD